MTSTSDARSLTKGGRAIVCRFVRSARREENKDSRPLFSLFSAKVLCNRFSRKHPLLSATVKCFSLLIATLVLFDEHAFALQLNSGAVEPSQATTQDFLAALKTMPSEAQHGLARFSRHVTESERKSLAAFGVSVLGPFQGNTYWVGVRKRVNLRAVQNMKLDMYLIRLRDEDRVDPRIWRGNFDGFSVTLRGKEPVNYVLNPDGTLNLTVRFHTDVSGVEAKRVLQNHARRLTKKSDAMWVVVMPSTAVRALAAEDVVRSINAGPPPLTPENNSTREAIRVDPVQNFDTTTGQVLGLGGNGVRVGVFDTGIYESHGDFIGRVIRNMSDESPHGTQVAGTVLGSGFLSNASDSVAPGVSGTPFQWRGMAPRAELLEESWRDGDAALVHQSRIMDPGMQLSNHSYGFEYDGAYTDSDGNRDGIIRGFANGTALPPRLAVYSAGNGGESCTDATTGAVVPCPASGYFSITKQFKNGLVVGNWNYMGADWAQRKRIALDSSLGPAHDGRIKPDVVAPGADIRSTVSPSSLSLYGLYGQTSAASAATTGSLALVLQQYAFSYFVTDLNQTMPLPSTLRAVMIHTAKDIQVPAADPPWFDNADGPVKPTPGPDFVTGWGLIDAEAAVDLVAGRRLHEDTLTQECEVKTYAFFAGTTPRVTLAWDDPPFDVGAAGASSVPITAPKLLNDLDLVLIDPNGQPHYPWKLDQEIHDPATDSVLTDAEQQCGSAVDVIRQVMPAADPAMAFDTIPPGGVPAAVRGRDHLNNVEVVDVEAAAAAGNWEAQVIGFYIPEVPQRFSLAGYEFLDVSIPPEVMCKVNDVVCEAVPVPLVCKKYPWVCTTKIVLPTNDRIPVRFGSLKEKRIVPLDKVCGLFAECPHCVQAKSCPRYAVEVSMSGAALKAEIYSSRGRRLLRDTSANLHKVLSFSPRAGEEYLLVLSPGRGTQLNKSYEVTARVRE